MDRIKGIEFLNGVYDVENRYFVPNSDITNRPYILTKHSVAYVPESHRRTTDFQRFEYALGTSYGYRNESKDMIKYSVWCILNVLGVAHKTANSLHLVGEPYSGKTENAKILFNLCDSHSIWVSNPKNINYQIAGGSFKVKTVVVDDCFFTRPSSGLTSIIHILPSITTTSVKCPALPIHRDISPIIIEHVKQDFSSNDNGFINRELFLKDLISKDVNVSCNKCGTVLEYSTTAANVLSFIVDVYQPDSTLELWDNIKAA